jgi:fumarate reductase subunit C
MSRKPYLREEGWRWIFRHPRYLRYMAREFSCLFIGGYTLLLVCGLQHLAAGPAGWEAFLQMLRSPLSVALQVLALAFALYHSITWFQLTPKALPLQIGENFVAEGVIAGAHFAAWAGLTAAVLYLAGAF